MNVAVIPARGGSKRIPRKNLREFAGKPMIVHSIDCAARSGVFDRIIVSTDDTEIAKIATAVGAEVPFVRPAELADDHAGTTDVIAHAAHWLEQQGATPASICCIYATAPFMHADDLRRGRDLMQAGSWDYVFSATTYAFPVQRAIRRDPGGGVQMLFPEHFATRSQDLPEIWHDAGQFYWGRPTAWRARAPVFGAASTIVELPRWRVQDIDTLEDWQRAEITWQLLQRLEKAG